jgi:hypothetical protein
LDRTTREITDVMDDEPSMRLAFSADTTRLYSVTLDRLRAWELRTDAATNGLRVKELELPARGDRHFRDSTSAEIFDDGGRWLSISKEPRARRPSLSQGRFDSLEIESRREIDPGGNEPHVSPDGRWLAWGNWHARDVAITRLGTLDPPVVLPIAGSASVAFSPDSRLLAVGGAEEIRFYEVGALRVVHSILRLPSRPLPPEFAFMRGSSLCAIAASDEILLVDTKTGASRHAAGAVFHPLGATFSPDDRYLAATGTGPSGPDLQAS